MEEKERIENEAESFALKNSPIVSERYTKLGFKAGYEFAKQYTIAAQYRITELEEEVKDWRDTKYVLAKNAAKWRGEKIKELEEENKRLKAVLEPFRKLSESVLVESEVVHKNLNRPLYSYNFTDITYQDLQNVLEAIKAQKP